MGEMVISVSSSGAALERATARSVPLGHRESNPDRELLATLDAVAFDSGPMSDMRRMELVRKILKGEAVKLDHLATAKKES